MLLSCPGSVVLLGLGTVRGVCCGIGVTGFCLTLGTGWAGGVGDLLAVLGFGAEMPLDVDDVG